MFSLTQSPSASARIMLAGTWGFFCAMIFGAPILLSYSCHRAAAILYFSFSSICHQIPDRSFFILGYPLPLCHRCSGIYIGLLLGSLIENRLVHRSPLARRAWILAACIPMIVDVALSYSGLWLGTGYIRFFTGLWLGYLISALLVRGVTEVLTDPPWRRLVTNYPPLKKGYSWIQKEC